MEHTTMPLAPLDTRHLPAGVHSRFVESVNGLRMHVLEAGDEEPTALRHDGRQMRLSSP
jgi:hypothetical protein